MANDEDEVGAVALQQMRERGGTWAAYRCVALDHSQLGHLKFLKVGPGCTFEEAPKRLPDTATEINWSYQLVGKVDLESGRVVP